jgi:hypothetical protein
VLFWKRQSQFLEKDTSLGIDKCMALFLNWMVYRDVGELLRLLESAEFFRPSDYNQVFYGQLEKLIHRLPDGEARQQAMAMAVVKMTSCDLRRPASNQIARATASGAFPRSLAAAESQSSGIGPLRNSPCTRNAKGFRPFPLALDCRSICIGGSRSRSTSMKSASK